MAHELPELGYAYDALEPHIDKQTMMVHHDKHHKAYTDKFNAALEKYPELMKKKPEDLLKELSKVPEDIRTAVRNHGGGYVNHKFFWTILAKGKKCSGAIAKAINKDFGSFDAFKQKFSDAAAAQFGSGWAWLVISKGKLEVIQTSNQDSPLSVGKIPLLTIDIWEHAYYLKYQNKRPEYIENFFNVINWDKVNGLFEAAQ